MGGVTTFFPFVSPQHRGRNLNAEMNLILDNIGQRRGVSQYSPSGFGSRVATHRLHVERAMSAGQEIPEEVMMDYVIRDGSLVLREPWTVEAHNAWVEEKRMEEMHGRYVQETRDCLHVFMTLEDMKHGSFTDLSAEGKAWFCHHGHTFSSKAAPETPEPSEEARFRSALEARGYTFYNQKKTDTSFEIGLLQKRIRDGGDALFFFDVWLYKFPDHPVHGTGGGLRAELSVQFHTLDNLKGRAVNVSTSVCLDTIDEVENEMRDVHARMGYGRYETSEPELRI